MSFRLEVLNADFHDDSGMNKSLHQNKEWGAITTPWILVNGGLNQDMDGRLHLSQSDGCD